MLKQLLPCSRISTNMLLVCTSLISFAITDTFAQHSAAAKRVANEKELYQQLHSAAVNGKQNTAKNIQTTETTLKVIIEVNKPELVIGKIEGNSTSSAFFNFADGKLVSGKVVIPSDHKAYNYYADKQANVYVEEIDINKVICIDYLAAPLEKSAENTSSAPDAVPLLQSLPGSASVIMIDFDGQNVSGGNWGTINAAAAGFTDAKMKMAWEVVAEDYRPYDVNVTTDESIFQAAAKNKRKRCVVTPTNDAAKGAGGVAYIGSFDDGNDGNVAWVFNLGGDGKVSGETVSHEIGHTVGLNHDGPNYYMGHANKLWGPIMGATYSVTVGQWSKGEYQGADRKEDDVTIIGTKNGFGYRADEAGNTIAAAKALKIGTSGTVTGTDNYGIILKQDDIDVYSFSTSGGQVTLDVKPAPLHPNLDVLLKLTDASGKEIASANPTTTLSASVSARLDRGTYYLHIDGTGVADPLTTGYTDYASIGEYTISGTVEGGSGIKNIAGNAIDFQTYPNPTNGLVTVKIANATDKNDIRVVNMVGQEVFSKLNASSLTTIDLGNYSNGIYFITVANANGVTTSKLIKE